MIDEEGRRLEREYTQDPNDDTFRRLLQFYCRIGDLEKQLELMKSHAFFLCPYLKQTLDMIELIETHLPNIENSSLPKLSAAL